MCESNGGSFGELSRRKDWARVTQYSIDWIKEVRKSGYGNIEEVRGAE